LQDYGAEIQLVCGVADAADPAVVTVGRLRQQMLHRDIAMVTDARVIGANRKISNLHNMLEAAKHDVLVLADADIEVPRDWLSAVISALSRPGAGAASCLYVGEGTGLWAQLAAMGISYNFLPNAAFGIESGLAHPCFG